MLRDPHTILALSVLAHVPREWSFILRAKARCGYGRQCPFPRYEGVAIHEHFLPKACFSTLRGESVRKHAAFMTINGSLTEINVENQRAQHAQANPDDMRTEIFSNHFCLTIFPTIPHVYPEFCPTFSSTEEFIFVENELFFEKKSK